MAPRRSSRSSRKSSGRKSSGARKSACRPGMKKAVKTTMTRKVGKARRSVYKGPQGGKFYLSGGKKHCKVYLPKRKSSGRKSSGRKSSGRKSRK